MRPPEPASDADREVVPLFYYLAEFLLESIRLFGYSPAHSSGPDRPVIRERTEALRLDDFCWRKAHD